MPRILVPSEIPAHEQKGLGALRQIDVAAPGSKLWLHEKIDAAYQLLVDAQQMLKWKGDSSAAKELVDNAETVVSDVLTRLQEDKLSRELRAWDTAIRVVRSDMEKVQSTIQQIKTDGDTVSKRLDLCIDACAEAMWDLSRILAVV